MAKPWKMKHIPFPDKSGNGLRVKSQRVKLPKTSQKKAIFREDFEDIQKSIKSCKSDIFYLLRNLLKYLLRKFFSSTKFSEVFTLCVFTLWLFPTSFRIELPPIRSAPFPPQRGPPHGTARDGHEIPNSTGGTSGEGGSGCLGLSGLPNTNKRSHSASPRKLEAVTAGASK